MDIKIDLRLDSFWIGFTMSNSFVGVSFTDTFMHTTISVLGWAMIIWGTVAIFLS